MLLVIRKVGTDLFWSGREWVQYSEAQVIVVPHGTHGRVCPTDGEFLSLRAAHQRYCNAH